jgi:hypothetical protein
MFQWDSEYSDHSVFHSQYPTTPDVAPMLFFFSAKSAKGRILRHWGNVLGTSSGRFLHHIWPLVTIFLQIDSGLWIFLQAPFCWQIVCFVTHRPHSSTVFFVSLIGNTTEQETNCPIIG